MLLVQMLLAFMYFVYTTDYFTLQFETPPGIGLSSGTWLPRWLRRLRLDSRKWLFGDPGCVGFAPVETEHEVECATYVEDLVNYCGLICNLLHPGGTLNVISLVDDVYALSSTPFLLLVR